MTNSGGSSFIGSVTINDYGYLSNGANSTIDLLTIQSTGSGTPVVKDNGTAYYGVYNWERGTIGSAIVNNGDYTNENSSNYTYDNGVAQNYNDDFTRIGTVFLDGGTVNNVSKIDNLVYTEGTYDGRQAEKYVYGGTRQSFVGTGTIGTLTLAGDARGIDDWANVENLNFDSNGNGILRISAFADGVDFGYTGVNAGSVDVAYGNILLDLSGIAGISDDDWVSAFFNAFGYDNGFYLYELFGFSSEDTFGGVEDFLSLEVAFGEMDSFWLISDGVFGIGWNIDTDTGFVSYDTGGGNGSVPEPATLVMLGLGLAGLGLARRRM